MSSSFDQSLVIGSRWCRVDNPDSIVRIDMVRRNDKGHITSVSWTALPKSLHSGGGAPITHFSVMFTPVNSQPIDGQLSLQLPRTSQ